MRASSEQDGDVYRQRLRLPPMRTIRRNARATQHRPRKVVFEHDTEHSSPPPRANRKESVSTDVTKQGFFSDVMGMPNTLAATLAQAAVALSLKRNDIFMKAGEPFSRVGFLQSGALRTFTSNEYGHEFTNCLQAKPGSIIAPTPEFGIASPATIVALTESDLLVVGVDTIQEAIVTDPAAKKYYDDVVLAEWELAFAMGQMFKCKTARERYLWLAETFPELLGNVPDHYLASFLGMNPVTFSRVQTAAQKSLTASCGSSHRP